MKIIKYQKGRNNKYDIYVDNGDKFSLYSEVILNNDLLLTKEIDDINILLKENEYYEAYYDAIKYLNRKLRTTKELEKYLSNKYEFDNVSNVIKRLEEEKYLNDELFVNSYIHDCFILTNKGYYKIFNELEKLGIDNDLIRNSLDKISDEEWLEKLKKLVEKKIKINSNYSNNKLMNKLNNYFINLGYSSDMIDDILGKIDNVGDKDILEKKYNKLYNRLSKKYQDKNLEYQIFNRLLKDGFSYEDIKEVINNK